VGRSALCLCAKLVSAATHHASEMPKAKAVGPRLIRAPRAAKVTAASSA
jgi:hypothetical protein